MTTADISLAELAALQVVPQSWDHFKAEFLPAYTHPLVSRKHAGKVRQVVAILDGLGVTSTADLNLALVARFVQSRPADQSPWTTKALLQIVSSLCTTAVAARRLAVNPFAIRPIGRIVRLTPPKGKRTLSRDEIRRLLELLKSDAETRTGWPGWRAKRLYVAAAIASYCGLRRSELLTLHVSDVDLEARVIRLFNRGPNGKGLKSAGSAKPVGIPDALAEIIRGWLPWRMARPKGFRLPDECPWLIPTVNGKAPWLSGAPGTKPLDRLQAAAKRAGIDEITWHMLRRSLATHLEHHGVGGAMIQRILRHSSSATTERHYRCADEANVAAAVKNLVF